MHNLPYTRKNLPATLAKSKCFLHLALISEWEPAWSHLIDFLRMRILKKKNHLTAIKIKRLMILESCLYIYGQDGSIIRLDNRADEEPFSRVDNQNLA